MPTIPPDLLSPNIRPHHTVALAIWKPDVHKPKVVIQSLRIHETSRPPVLINTNLQVLVGICQLGLQIMNFLGAEWRPAVVVLVERVVGQASQVLEVGIVANCFGVFKHADYVISGVVKDPITVGWEEGFG
jgi:hypothetical protein